MPQNPIPSTLLVTRLIAGNDITLSPISGTGEVTVNATGSVYNPANVTISGGTINGVVLGGSTPAAGHVTTLSTTDDFTSTKSVSTTNPSTERLQYSKISLTYAGAVTAGSGSGSIAGDRGEVAVGNAATVLGAGYYYGTQGKITAVSGATIGAGAHAFGLVGQFDLSLGAVTGDPQISPIWGDMGATGPSTGWGVNSSLISSQNTTAFATNSHIYTYGAAAYYATISSNGGAFLTTGAATPSGTMKKLKVSIDGADFYILAAATWS